MSKSRQEFGDFQTPARLCDQVIGVLRRDRQISPRTVVEPTCGVGRFLAAAERAFPEASSLLGIEINPVHVRRARRNLARSTVHQGDFFAYPWQELLAQVAGPLLIVGNPPWVTNSALCRLDSRNLPNKVNRVGVRGIDAITGSSNFDICEAMLLGLLDWLPGKAATIAMLCKTSTARRVLRQSWRQQRHLGAADIYRIDAERHFSVNVDACLLVVGPGDRLRDLPPRCQVHESLEASAARREIGFARDELVADWQVYNRWQRLQAQRPVSNWRSGIKHDCARIVELAKTPDGQKNGLGESLRLEPEYLYPMLKSSELVRDCPVPTRLMLVPQIRVGESTRGIARRAPRTWEYLESHAAWFDRRRSSIYRGRDRFAVFGVGEYSFVPWKVAIAGFYKSFAFRVVGPHHGRPVVFDDTCYFLPCSGRSHAQRLAAALNDVPAQAFLSSMVFWDSKRPVTAALLRRLDLDKLLHE